MTFDKDSMALGPYRALDLTEGGYNWCGKVLADLGADVIKVEPPGGSPTRYHWPLYPGQEEPDRSWFWEVLLLSTSAGSRWTFGSRKGLSC